MKKLSFVALLLLTVFMTSCNGLGGGTTSNIDKSQIVGKWMTADGQYFEVYNSDGTGKEWDLRDDVTEDEASTFTWEFDEGAEDKFLKYYKMEINDAIVPQDCNILELTSTDFKYNNEGFRATYNLIRAD
jgi:hypothetical protein